MTRQCLRIARTQSKTWLRREHYFHPHLEILENRSLMHGGSALEQADESATVASFSDPATVAATSASQSAGVSTQPASSGQWTSLRSWSTEAVNAVMLPTGKVMVWNYTLGSAFLYDPVANSYSTPSQAAWNAIAGKRDG